mgnify:FL=1
MAFEVGALQNLPNNRNQPFGYNLIGQRTNVAPTFSSGRRFQDYIGTPALTSFPFVESIVTGQVQYNANNPTHTAKMGEYANWKRRNPEVDAPTVGELTQGLATDFATKVGSNIGAAMVNPANANLSMGETAAKGFKNFFSGNPVEVAARKGVGLAKELPSGVLGPLEKIPVTDLSDMNPFEKFGKRIDFTTDVGKANYASAAGGAVANFGVQLLMGQDPAKAARSAGAGMLLGTIGGAFGPFGRFLGQAIGGALGGRVICNELMRQGLLTRKEVVLDYKFTRDHLTPTHVNGYHVWAVWMVKQMRKGKFVKFWKHVAGHRANEIAYIYGERDKPDYLGKIYRKILEPTCWVIGSFCKGTDWSVLYKQKEI